MGVISQFYKKIGIKKLKYKPAYNPYTEPSLEIFGFHPTLKRWVEIGNSGVFRPEMLRPMGLPEDVNVIAWGLSLERPTMIHYNLNNIRDLFGHKVPLSSTKNNQICYIVS
jgi:phenylalanyl-tRNA synthetase alpha chain